MDTARTIWDGDWHTKIVARVREQGSSSVADFATKNPCLPYYKLAEKLGKDVAAVQVAMMHFEEAKAKGSIRAIARDAFCRAIHEHLKRGWGKGMHVDFNTAGAYTEWLVVLEFRALAPELLPLGEAVWKAFEEGNPPVGWLPSGPEDPIIVAAFDKGWPVPKQKLKRKPYGLHCPKCDVVLKPPTAEQKEITCHYCGEVFELI